MVGSGIASSLVHEVGHQAAALLELVESLRPMLQERGREGGEGAEAWGYWERWISEIVADFWSVARIGIGSTQGLMAVVSLPRAFVFRITEDDPHPAPWMRVKLSCAMGRALYPHPQWDGMAQLWESFYPSDDLDEGRRRIFAALEATMPEFVQLLLNHRPEKLRGQTLFEVMSVDKRQPAQLAELYEAWRHAPARMRATRPSLAFAVIGQARADGTLTPAAESRMLAYLLTYWALRSTLDTSAFSARSLLEAGRRRAELVAVN